MRTIIIAIALILPACTALETVREYSAEAAYRLLRTECQLSISQRGLNARAVDRIAKEKNEPYRAIAQDCDGDGKPDF